MGVVEDTKTSTTLLHNYNLARNTHDKSIIKTLSKLTGITILIS
jgi:hypothetical protein